MSLYKHVAGKDEVLDGIADLVSAEMRVPDPAGDWKAEIRRTEFDTMAVSNAISARGLPGDVYRAATVRNGKLVR